MNCFIIVGECGALVREKMAKYGVDTSGLQCFSQTRGKKKKITPGSEVEGFCISFYLTKICIFLGRSPPLLLYRRVRLDGNGVRSRTQLPHLSYMNNRTNRWRFIWSHDSNLPHPYSVVKLSGSVLFSVF